MWLPASLVLVASVAPSFDLDASAWSATDVVVVSEGVAIDGEVTVLEVWKGDLPRGGVHRIPDLAAFAPEEARRTSEAAGPVRPVVVDAERIVLFLRREAGGDAPRFAPAASWGGLRVSMAWLDRGRAWAWVQLENGGPLRLVDVGSELDVEARVAALTRLQADLRATSAIGELDQRVRALARFAREPVASAEAFQLLTACGHAAVPALEALMAPEVGLAPQAAEALLQLPGDEAPAALLRVLAEELEFWSARGPGLPRGWWTGDALPGAEAELLRRRWGRVLVSIQALAALRAEEARPTILRHLELWSSTPALAEAGDGRVPEACRQALDVLSPPS